jgi:hypothetical protein
MSPFDILLLAHFLGDYFLQTGWMAGNKAKRWFPLLVHSAVYALTIAVFGMYFIKDFTWWGVLLVFVTHVVVDRRSITQWWVTNIMKAPASESVWLAVVVDQSFHFFVLAAALLIK